MTIGLLFWVIMILLIVLTLLGQKPASGQPWNWGAFGITLITWVLFALLGWQAFGPMLKR